MKEKVVLIGAGSAMFTRGLVADIIHRKWDVELALVDPNPEALSVAEKLTRKMLDSSKCAGVKVSASATRRDVLKDATVVICTVGVGGRRGWEQDVYIPRKYGIYQPVGDSVMPGGTSRALRMIPAMIDVAKDVMAIAPNALFFNYGNPMAAVCRGVIKATGANMIGLCHGVNHVGHYLAKILDVPNEAFQYTAVGINHLTWFTEARVRGIDAMPQLRAIARKRSGVVSRDVGTKFPEAGTAPEGSIAPSEDNPFSWKLFDLFGAFPAVLDRHVIEFFPQLFKDGKYFGKTLGVDAFSVEQTIAWGDKIFADMKEEAFSSKPMASDYVARLGGEHEQVTEIIESIRKSDGRVYSANLPNRGQVPNLPIDAVLESPAIADGGTLKPIQQRPLDPAIAGTLATRLAWVETTADAAIQGSRAKFIQALVLDGAVPNLEVAEKLADDLLAAHSQYLPQFK